MASAIETHGLTKTYGTTRAVVDLDLTIDTGQVFGFLGPNGAGKTTTIRMLLALQQPTNGGADVLGLDAQRDSVEIHRRIGYLPGDLALYPHMTGRQHIDWFLRARGERHRRFADMLVERFNVVMDRPAKQLSKGNRQKIGLILAFMHQPELLILDEPTSGLDPLMQNEFERLAHEVVTEGRTVFLSSHDLDEVQRLADRVSIIKSGTLITTDTVTSLRQNTPQKVEVEFREPLNPSLFASLPGVSVKTAEGSRMVMEVTGAIGPVLRVIGDHDPIDVICRHADLEELFLDLYRELAPSESNHAG